MYYSNLFGIPELSLEPVETRREVRCYCKLCDEPIYEGDDYYDFTPLFGEVCEDCAEIAHHYC